MRVIENESGITFVESQKYTYICSYLQSHFSHQSKFTNIFSVKIHMTIANQIQCG